jgi:diguanylate cyclase (GGDEF)-like protein
VTEGRQAVVATAAGSPTSLPTQPSAPADAPGAAAAVDARLRTAEQVAAELEILEDWLGLDVDATLTTALEVERAAEAIGDPELTHRARLVLVDVWDRKGELPSAVHVLAEVNRWAAEHGSRALLARTHLLLARVYYDLGDMESCLEHSVLAVETQDETTPPRRRAFYLTKLADALGWNGSFDAARERYRQAERLAMASGDVEMHVLVLNNLAYTEYDAGAPERAWEVVEEMRAVAEGTGWMLNTNKLDTIARIQIAMGRHAEAEQTALQSIRDYETHGYEEIDAVPEYLLTLALAQRCLGATDRAQVSLDKSLVLCEERALHDVRVRVLQEQAELYGALGDHQRAFELYKTFHALAEELRSQQREAQARTRQFLFETSEARQEAERFREQALRDPLTGLRNRRYLDEHLHGLIKRAVRDGAPLTIALADLDHFKRINDTLSHDVGDRVLVAFADLLTGLVAGSESAFVVRMGGEEFLAVLPDTKLADAAEQLEHLRHAVCTYWWQPITGELPVTVSIGAASTETADGCTQATLLADADRNLYAAKHAGRDQVVINERGGRRLHRDAPS